MPTSSSLDDDELASLLIQDARKTSARYVSQGLSALLPNRPTKSTAPKPNTRFLKSLVRDADTHNTKLREKEESEARERLRKTREVDRRKERERAVELTGRRDRDGKKRRLDGENHRSSTRSRRHHDHGRLREPSRSRSRSPAHKRRREHDYDEQRSRRRNTSSPELEEHGHRRKRRRNSSSEDEDKNEAELHRIPRIDRSKRKHRSRSRSHSETRTRDTRSDQRRKGHHRTPTSRVQNEQEHPTRQTHPHSVHLPQNETKHRRIRSPSLSSATSDPLTSILAPNRPASPTTKKRGRGFLRPSNPSQPSNIDLHFSQSYNPSDSHTHKGDVEQEQEQEQEDDDWTSALTHLHTRTAFHAAQTQRMREAGFTDEEVARWEKSATHPSRTLLGAAEDRDAGDVRDVKWKKKGEEREWDVGKISQDPSSEAESAEDVTSKTKPKTSSDQAENSKSRKTKLKNKDDGTSAWRRPQNGLLKQFKTALG